MSTPDDALSYHRTQATRSNIVLLAFLGVLVIFTLYRVIAEWNLAAQFQSVEEYKRAMEQADKKEEDLKLTRQELDFINGKDGEGRQITSASLRMDRNGTFRLRLIGGPPPVPDGQSYELHNRYSLFFKECRIGHDSELEVDRPTEFPSIALARVARDVLDGDPIRAISAFCGEDIAFVDKLTLISDSDATLLEGFRALNPLQQPKSSEDNCLTLRTAAEKLEQFDNRPWMQDEDTVHPIYVAESGGRCAYTDSFKRRASVAVRLARGLEKPFDHPSRELITKSERTELLKKVGLDTLRKQVNAAVATRANSESASVAQLNARMKELQSDINRLRSLKALPDGASNVRTQFSLVQFLFSALFVMSALTAAVTSAYMARSHLSEVVEIERFLRGADSGIRQRPNPFMKAPKALADFSKLYEILKENADRTTPDAKP